MDLNEYLINALDIDKRVLEFCDDVERGIKHNFDAIGRICELNQAKVLNAMRKNRLSDSHFSMSTGYGYGDAGRDVLERVYADTFSAEAALVRPQMISGTHALSVALFGNLRYGDELVSVTGRPYETLAGVIGIRETRGSLIEHGITYKQVDLINKHGLKGDTAGSVTESASGSGIDYAGIERTVTPKTRMVAIQRSKGYEARPSLSVSEIGNIIRLVKQINPGIICLVDNCYGEFVEIYEPGDVGADLTVGSLIKNPGGGLATGGGYIAGKAEYVENAAFNLTAPGLGAEIGPMLGATRAMLQGFFIAPQVVSASICGAVLASAVFDRLGYRVMPSPDEVRTDIVTAIFLGSAEKVIAFCENIQRASPVDSFVRPEPAELPGYDCPVIMAAGAFVQGSSIELSADAPIRSPYAVFLQGGLTWAHAKLGIVLAVDGMYKQGLLEI